MEFREISASELPLQLLSSFWREWFEADPWAERFRCPVHNPATDFSSKGRFKEAGECPECGSRLVPYWSQDRIDEYLSQVFAKPRLVVLGGLDDDGNVVAWAWGYSADEIEAFDDLPRGGLYIDHIGFDPSHDRQDVDGFLEAGERLARALGFTFMVTRTHKAAGYVQDAISPHGYAFLRDCPDEEDREYWAVPPW